MPRMLKLGAQLEAGNPNIPIVQTTSQTSISNPLKQMCRSRKQPSSRPGQDYEAKLAALQEALANNQKAQTDLKRYQMLVTKDEISRQQYDSSVANAKTAGSRCRGCCRCRRIRSKKSSTSAWPSSSRLKVGWLKPHGMRPAPWLYGRPTLPPRKRASNPLWSADGSGAS